MPTAFKKHLLDFARLFYPNCCEGCGNEVFHSTLPLCWRCLNELPKTGYEAAAHNPVSKIFYGRLPLQQAFSFLYFNKGSLTQHLIHQIKYRKGLALGEFMGRMMAQAMINQPHWQPVEVLVPMPLNDRKLKTRGYNQAELLCKGMASVLNKPVEPVAVMRTKYTDTQTRKTRMQRWRNVEHVFDLKESHRLENKHALLVDDVITTGATMEACGQILMHIPGITLSAASLAMAAKL